MIRVMLAGGSLEARFAVAELLRERLGLEWSADGFVLAAPPSDLEAFDRDLARRGAELDALLHFGGAPEELLERYGRAVVEVRSFDVDDILVALREALVAG